jgi:serine/threonine protein kinase
VKKPTPFGKYFLLERINVGGMAEVFRAKAFGVEGFERLVAVKRILPNIAEDKEFIRMFIEEAKLSVQLNHANIAQIFDLGVVESSYYIALEHVHGRDLRGIFDRCRTVGEAMPVAQACFIVMKACEGLDYAHNKRDQSGRELALVHRDVSPQNVLVSFEGEVKIIDFGIAKAAGKGSKTQAGILKGKFGYMSPEQVRGLPVDRRSDVFSCGIVLYELLTGERLFVGESDFSTLEKVRNVEILPPSTYNRRIPDELERIVLKALAKDTEDRYQNAIDLHDELQAFVYTAGEFYSRKDLAGWMKKTFGKEIEEETAKLESYRQLKPPPAEPPTLQPRTITGRQTPTPRKSTQAMNAVGTKPPPPPPRVSSSQLPVQVAAVPSLASKPPREENSSDQLNWDDDELETQIYDNPEDDPRNKTPQPVAAAPSKATSKQLPLTAPTSSQPAIPAVPRAAAGAPTQVAAAQAEPMALSQGSSQLVRICPGSSGRPRAAGKAPTRRSRPGRPTVTPTATARTAAPTGTRWRPARIRCPLRPTGSATTATTRGRSRSAPACTRRRTSHRRQSRSIRWPRSATTSSAGATATSATSC